MVEQAYTSSEKDGHEVDGDFVEESGPQALLHDTRSAYGDALVARYGLRLFDRALDAFRDERERRSFVDPFLWNHMGNDEDRYVHGVSAAPRVGDVERPASRHKSPYRCVHLPKELGADRSDLERHLATGHFIVGVAAEVPPQDPLTAIAQDPFGAVVRPRDETIQRH